jgi:hypothetical protein
MRRRRSRLLALEPREIFLEDGLRAFEDDQQVFACGRRVSKPSKSADERALAFNDSAAIPNMAFGHGEVFCSPGHGLRSSVARQGGSATGLSATGASDGPLPVMAANVHRQRRFRYHDREPALFLRALAGG